MRVEGPAPALSWRGDGERRLSDGESGECSLAGDLERFLEGDPDDVVLGEVCTDGGKALADLVRLISLRTGAAGTSRGNQ